MTINELGIPVYPDPVPHVLWEDLVLALGQKRVTEIQEETKHWAFTEFVPDAITVKWLERFIE